MHKTITRRGGLLALLMLCTTADAATAQEARIVQSRGVDPRVNYEALGDFAPWDDRNYALTLEDLDVLPPEEARLTDPIPAFFRVELRRTLKLPRSGPAQYSRAAVPLFYNRYGGLLRDGRIVDGPRAAGRAAARGTVPVNAEIDLSTLAGGNEVTIEINPVNPQLAVAGANVDGGQEMYFSTDGGQTWSSAGVLPDTCCDPSVDWSSDGNIAYAAAVAGSVGVSLWRSFDGGATWTDRVEVTTSDGNKEFVHVDRSPTSPYLDSVYLIFHEGTVLQIARSDDFGASFDVTSFTTAPLGTGGDLTTDSAGNVYGFYGAFSARAIVMLKSTDGGATFEPPVEIAATNAAFSWPIPAMETRGAWVYTAVAADVSGGPFNDSLYVAWTDTIDRDDDLDPLVNHSEIKVAYSRDGGATWTTSTPHSTDDVMDVDRFNQWLTVDEDGTVHVVYYDTRNSADRSGTDLYYAYSTDGAQSWSTPARISSATSANIDDGLEYGDYNGISVVGSKLIPTWTDNRDGVKDVFAADAVNPASTPGDSDADGIADATDNCTLLANADQTDTDGDDIGNRCDPDIALPNDCQVGFADLAALKDAFFTTPLSPSWNPDADFDANMQVNFADLGVVKDFFFQSPGPSAAGCN